MSQSQQFICVRGHGKSVQPLLNYAAEHGWSVDITKRNHLRFRKAGKQPMFTSSTPSDQRAVRNALARLARFDRMEANHA